jgi:hypothetical protein
MVDSKELWEGAKRWTEGKRDVLGAWPHLEEASRRLSHLGWDVELRVGEATGKQPAAVSEDEDSD